MLDCNLDMWSYIIEESALFILKTLSKIMSKVNKIDRNNSRTLHGFEIRLAYIVTNNDRQIHNGSKVNMSRSLTLNECNTLVP